MLSGQRDEIRYPNMSFPSLIAFTLCKALTKCKFIIIFF